MSNKGKGWRSRTTSKADLVERVAERTGMTKAAVTKAVDSFLNEVAAALLESPDARVECRRFGVWSKKTRASKVGKDWSTGEPVEIPERTVVVFAPGSTLAALVNSDGEAA